MSDSCCARFAAALARHAARGADAAAIAGLAMAAWREIDKALSAVIGKRGVAALFHRSVHLTAARHPWLAALNRDITAAIDLPAVERLLTQQAGALAAAAAAEQLNSFCDLLTSLIGASLTDRVLRPAWTRFESGLPSQDTLP